MASSPKLDDITRVLDLIAAPLALEVLDGLGHGIPMRDISPPGTPAGVLEEAVEYLRGVGAITIATEQPGGDQPALTPFGRRLFGAFQRASEFDQPDSAVDAGPNT